MNIWTSNQPGTEKIIVFENNTLYKGNPKATEIENALADLKVGVLPAKQFTGIPVSYIREVIREKGKPYIEVRFGKDSYEYFRVPDEQTRAELFGILHAALPNSRHSVEQYSKFKAGKKPLIALAVVLGLFLWTLHLAIGIEEGSEYVVVGRQNSLAGIVLMLASLGVQKVSGLFAVLFVIAGFSFYRKAKNPPEVERIVPVW